MIRLFVILVTLAGGRLALAQDGPAQAPPRDGIHVKWRSHRSNCVCTSCVIPIPGMTSTRPTPKQLRDPLPQEDPRFRSDPQEEPFRDAVPLTEGRSDNFLPGLDGPAGFEGPTLFDADAYRFETVSIGPVYQPRLELYLDNAEIVSDTGVVLVNGFDVTLLSAGLAVETDFGPFGIFGRYITGDAESDPFSTSGSGGLGLGHGLGGGGLGGGGGSTNATASWDYHSVWLGVDIDLFTWRGDPFNIAPIEIKLEALAGVLYLLFRDGQGKTDTGTEFDVDDARFTLPFGGLQLRTTIPIAQRVTISTFASWLYLDEGYGVHVGLLVDIRF